MSESEEMEAVKKTIAGSIGMLKPIKVPHRQRTWRFDIETAEKLVWTAMQSAIQIHSRHAAAEAKETK